MDISLCHMLPVRLCIGFATFILFFFFFSRYGSGLFGLFIALIIDYDTVNMCLNCSTVHLSLS